jgi:DNA-binding MarR family transcriptional regulator
MATRTELPDGTAGARLSAPALRFVLHWGEMGVRWGVNRTVAQIQALLYFHGRPFHAEEIAEVLEVARSNVSTSLRELQSWNLVRMVHRLDDRRDYYETARDPWELMRLVVRERKAREFDDDVRERRRALVERIGSGFAGVRRIGLRDRIRIGHRRIVRNDAGRAGHQAASDRKKLREKPNAKGGPRRTVALTKPRSPPIPVRFRASTAACPTAASRTPRSLPFRAAD